MTAPEPTLAAERESLLGLVLALQMVNDVRRTQQAETGWTDHIAGLSEAFDVIATEITMRQFKVARTEVPDGLVDAIRALLAAHPEVGRDVP